MFRDRQEVEMLKAQLTALQEESRKKDSRNIQALDRLKRRNEQLAKRNEELEEEVRILEVSRAKFIEEKQVLQVGKLPCLFLEFAQ